MDNTPRGRDAGGYRKVLWVDAISQQALSAAALLTYGTGSWQCGRGRNGTPDMKRLRNKINHLWDKRMDFIMM